MRVKGLVWLGIPAGDYAAAVGSSVRPWAWRWPSMRGTLWSWQPGTATGSSCSARPPLLPVLPQPGRRHRRAA